MSEDELLNAFENSKSIKDSKEINKEYQNDDEMIRDLRFVYEPKKLLRTKKNKRCFWWYKKSMDILYQYLLLNIILER